VYSISLLLTTLPPFKSEGEKCSEVLTFPFYSYYWQRFSFRVFDRNIAFLHFVPHQSSKPYTTYVSMLSYLGGAQHRIFMIVVLKTLLYFLHNRRNADIKDVTDNLFSFGHSVKKLDV